MTQELDIFENEFKGSPVKTPFEKMRARAIITAGVDQRGLGMINFNLPAFLSYEKKPSAYLILSLWAINPIREHMRKFRAHPEEGRQALYHRVAILENNLRNRRDLPKDFLETAVAQMKKAIDKEMAYLTNSAA